MENDLVDLSKFRESTDSDLDIVDSPFGLSTNEPVESNVPVVNIGFSDDVLDKAIDYMEGKSQELDFLEKFKADNNSKIKDFALISTATQLARIPSLIKYLNNVYLYLYSANTLADMDSKDLSNLGRNLSSEINSIMESARKTIDSLEKSSGMSSEYKDLLDSLLSQTPEELAAMKDFLESRKQGVVEEAEPERTEDEESVED